MLKFDDSKTTSEELASCWKERKVVLTGHATQTSVEKGTSAETQSTFTHNASIQTDQEPALAKYDINTTTSSFDHEKVLDFLNRVKSDVSSQLIANSQSTAFQGYSVQWEQEVKEITLSYVLSPDTAMDDLEISDQTWNATGSTIAASYSAHSHSDWCTHKGLICAWNLSQRNFDPAKPTFIAETSSCLMAIAFHPKIPSLIAGGTFTGEIIVWRTIENQDPVFAVSKISDYSHHEPVAQLRWIPSDRYNYNLFSVGNDGKILEWDLENKLITPIRISQVGTKSIPRMLKGQLGSAALGITSVCWTKDNPAEYLIGTETGFVLRCTKKNANSPKDVLNSVNPVLFSYLPHIGSCLDISFSPFHHNLFLTCSSDGTVHLYHILSSPPILTWEPSSSGVVAVRWSTTRPSVFSCTCSNGMVFVYDLTHSKTSPITEMAPIEEAGELSKGMAMSFNTHRKDLLGVGMNRGRIHIWRLKSTLTDQAEGDQQTINNLGSLDYIY